MFVSDLKSEFYDKIINERVLLLVGFDVDALAACKILQYLFQCDNVLYTLVPISLKSDVPKAYKEHGEQVKYVIMINCGATWDVVETCEPNEETIFFIADSHRPIDVYNVYNDGQVRLLMKLNEEEGIPAFDDLFREDEASDDENELSVEEIADKRREKRLWEERRHKIMFEYTQFNFYGQSTAVLMFELAWKMSKDTNDVLWWGVVGLTEQYVHKKIEANKYVLEAGSLQGHVSRHNHQNENENAVSVNSVKLMFDKELELCLYRHWSLLESLQHTQYTACKFKLWSLKGQKKLYEVLAELGIPLSQCKQKFSSMDIQLKANVKDWIFDISSKYDLDQIAFGCFAAQFGYKHKFFATDVAYSASALLESVSKERSTMEKFLDALDSLSWVNLDMLEKGIELAKHQMVAVFKQVQSFLDMHHVISVGPFLYAVIQEGTPDSKYFCQPGCLLHLARFLLTAHVSRTRSRKSQTLPLVLAAPAPEPGYSLIAGIPPVSEESPKNFFSKAFEQASEKAHCTFEADYLEASVAKIYSEDRSKFFDSLISLLC